MITVIGQALAVLAGVIGLVAAWWKFYGSPRAKARRKAVKDGSEAAQKLDPSGVTSAFDKLRRKR